MLGWKTRKVLESMMVQNYRRQVDELIEFYGGKDSGNKYIQKAKENYIAAVNRALANPNWWQDLVNSKTIEEKRERVQKMREKTKRLRENKVEPRDLSHSNNYSLGTGFKSHQSKPQEGSGLTFAFDFSKPNKIQDRNYEEEQKDLRRKRIEENRQKKTNFLKRRSNMKYDPMKAVEEDRYRRKIIAQSELSSMNYQEGESIISDNQPYVSASAIKLGELIEKEKQRKILNKKKSVKEIMQSPAPSINKSKTSIKDNFQKLDYLKKIPKRIDCWLSKDKQSNHAVNLHNHEKSMAKDSNDSKLIDISPKAFGGQTTRVIESFSDFSKAVGLNKNKFQSKGADTSQNIVSASRDFNYCSRLNESNASYDSFQILHTNRSHMNFKYQNDVQGSAEFKSPKNRRDSLFSNEGECLEFILDRLEAGSNYQGIMSSTDKLILREDRSMYIQLKSSKPLLEIFRLMNTVDKNNSNPTSAKPNYDKEFEALLRRLKDEYNSLFRKRAQEKQ
mmetsp:Transcript_40354/g.46309  ORF Transcript_40354/g.46309 Transcript_40354/m.46309 type:complete len:504 (+) Transcript_40354:241-1752(+)